MTSIAIKDLKRPRELRDMLTREHEVFVTKDGRPFAIMVGIDAESADDTLRCAVPCFHRPYYVPAAEPAPISPREFGSN